MLAFEVKAGSRVGPEDLRGLRMLKDRLGERLQHAIVLYTGEYAYTRHGWITGPAARQTLDITRQRSRLPALSLIV